MLKDFIIGFIAVHIVFFILFVFRLIFNKFIKSKMNVEFSEVICFIVIILLLFVLVCAIGDVINAYIL